MLAGVYARYMDHSVVWRVAVPADLGSLIVEARGDRGWTQQELARRCSVGRMTISRAENGEPVSSSTVLRIVSELGLKVMVTAKQARVTVVGHGQA